MAILACCELADYFSTHCCTACHDPEWGGEMDDVYGGITVYGCCNVLDTLASIPDTTLSLLFARLYAQQEGDD